jgi:cytochrome o ubiquinol oxidase operon protein cyoD
MSFRQESAKSLLKSYIIGFILTVAFVLASYFVVQKQLFVGESLYVALAVLIVLQILSLVIFFLRLNAKTEDDKWNLLSFVFTLVIIAIVVTGSLWIMYNLNYYMVH